MPQPAELRVLYYESPSTPEQFIYTVPVGEIVVITAWTLTSESGVIVTVRLRRNETRVAYNRIWEPSRGHNHMIFPTGIPFTAGDVISLECAPNSGQHYFYGYISNV